MLAMGHPQSRTDTYEKGKGEKRGGGGVEPGVGRETPGEGCTLGGIQAELLIRILGFLGEKGLGFLFSYSYTFFSLYIF